MYTLIPTIVYYVSSVCLQEMRRLTSFGMTDPLMVKPFVGVIRDNTPGMPPGPIRRDSFTTAVCILLAICPKIESERLPRMEASPTLQSLVNLQEPAMQHIAPLSTF